MAKKSIVFAHSITAKKTNKLFIMTIQTGDYMLVFTATLGCKVNQYETQVMLAQLIGAGFEITFDSSAADIFIINSCTVTANSDRKTRMLIRRFRRENPNGVIILTGCMTQAFADSMTMPEEVDIVLGNTSRAKK